MSCIVGIQSHYRKWASYLYTLNVSVLFDLSGCVFKRRVKFNGAYLATGFNLGGIISSSHSIQKTKQAYLEYMQHNYALIYLFILAYR